VVIEGEHGVGFEKRGQSFSLLPGHGIGVHIDGISLGKAFDGNDDVIPSRFKKEVSQHSKQGVGSVEVINHGVEVKLLLEEPELNGIGGIVGKAAVYGPVKKEQTLDGVVQSFTWRVRKVDGE